MDGACRRRYLAVRCCPACTHGPLQVPPTRVRRPGCIEASHQSARIVDVIPRVIAECSLDTLYVGAMDQIRHSGQLLKNMESNIWIYRCCLIDSIANASWKQQGSKVCSKSRETQVVTCSPGRPQQQNPYHARTSSCQTLLALTLFYAEANVSLAAAPGLRLH